MCSASTKTLPGQLAASTPILSHIVHLDTRFSAAPSSSPKQDSTERPQWTNFDPARMVEARLTEAPTTLPFCNRVPLASYLPLSYPVRVLDGPQIHQTPMPCYLYTKDDGEEGLVAAPS